MQTLGGFDSRRADFAEHTLGDGAATGAAVQRWGA